MNTVLKKARQTKGLTQVEIALKVAISETSYQRIEYGKQRPNLDTAIRIARVLDCTVEELFGIAVPDNENTTK